MFRSSSIKWLLPLIMLTVFLLIVTSISQETVGASSPITHQSLQTPSNPTTTARKILVDAGDSETTDALLQQGATLLVDYGAFSLWQLAPETGSMTLSRLTDQGSVTLRDDFDTIYLRGTSINPTQQTFPAVVSSLQQTRTADEQFWMVQFVGPIQDDWLDALRQQGLQLVSYMPNHAYVVWGTGEHLTNLEELADRSSFIQWTGPYHPAYRLDPQLEASLQNQQRQDEANDDKMTSVTVQLYTTPQTEQSLDRLREPGGKVLWQPVQVRTLTNISLQLPANQLADIAAWPDVYNVEAWYAPEKLDEVQGQIIAGNVMSDSSQIVPTSPGYLDWLASKGFPTDPSRYPIVDIVDDGIDGGDAENMLHPDFYQEGDTNKPDRMVYIGNCTTDFNGNGIGGHGTINAGIVGGYNNLQGQPYQDDQQYHYGLGISPYSRLAGTKVFENFGGFDVSACGGSLVGVVEEVYKAGATMSTNSWGNRYYNYDSGAQAYDALTRDASTSLNGNQEMLHIFSAGNGGRSRTIGSPGSAKNVLTVGATENVRDNGIVDGCSESNGDNADDIADFSSRGPTGDGRMKPDIVAPGTHVQGPASQDEGFQGSSVCGASNGPYYPRGQTLYTWSSGTSHSAPALAGAASLVYEYYGRILNPGKKPSPAMIKALLLNSTRFVTGEEAHDTLPSPSQGWGSANLGRLFDGLPRTLIDQQIVFHTSGEEYQISGTIADPNQPLRVSLVWTDAPGSTTGGVSVNNLDLEVTINGERYPGNVFQGAFSASGESSDSVSFDEKNNVEQVFLPPGLEGNFRVRVIASNIAGDAIPGNEDETDQDFALVISNDIYGGQKIGTLQGTIRDIDSGKPVAGATIQASSSPTRTLSVKGQDDGTFTMPLPVGTYVLAVSAYGYEQQRVQNVVVRDNAYTTQEIALTVLPRVQVQGKVHDTSQGKRPIYAQVQATVEEHIETAFTNPATGVYTLSLVPGIKHTLTVEAVHTENYHSQGKELVPSSQGNTLDVGLKQNVRTCSAPGYVQSYNGPFVYQADFEQDDGGYTTQWAVPWDWTTMPSEFDAAHSGTKGWRVDFAGRENAYTDNYLQSPNIDMSGQDGQLYISWWSWYDSEYSYVDLSVLVSNNGGENWYQLYYNGFPVNEHWVYHSAVIDPSYAVEDFRIRFRVDPPIASTPTSFMIDDIGIQVIAEDIVYNEDFERTNGNFTVQNNALESEATWEWGIPLTGPGYAHSGQKVWATNLKGDFSPYENSMLESPVIDLSNYAGKKMLLFWWQWLFGSSSGFTTAVELSADGGQTWEPVLPERTETEKSWSNYQVRIDEKFATSTFRFRFSFLAGYMGRGPGYYLDDMQIEVSEYPCQEQAGGLVVGHVYDENTGEGLNNVFVTDGKGHSTRTFATEQDTSREDGLYVLYVPEGTHTLSTVGKEKYVTEDVEISNLADGGTVEHDFRLAAGKVSFLPSPMQITLPLSANAVVPLTLINSGKISTTFLLEEQLYGYEPLHLPAVSIPHSQDNGQPPAENGWLHKIEPDTRPSAREMAADTSANDDSATQVYQPAEDGLIQTTSLDVLLLASTPIWELQRMLLSYPDIGTVDIFDARQETPAVQHLLAYDVVLVASEEPFADPVALGDVLADYLDADGKVIQAAPTFYAEPGSNWDIQGRFQQQGYSPFVGTGSRPWEASLGTFDANHPIMRGVEAAFENLRQTVVLTREARLIASWLEQEENDQEVQIPFVATSGNVVAINSFVSDIGYWQADIDIIVHNSVVWLHTRDQTPWFSVRPVTGTVGLSSTLNLLMMFDTNRSLINRPGKYIAQLQIKNDTPYGTTTIPITMTVKAPESWRKLAGTITSGGYCREDPSPLANARITVENSRGMTWTTTSTLSGTYQLWLDATDQPFTMTVAADEHQPSQEHNISFAEKQQVVQDAQLAWQQPCLQTDVTMLGGDLLPGERRTVRFSLLNQGDSAATFELAESSLGFVPLNRQHTTLPYPRQTIRSRHATDVAPAKSVEKLLLNASGMGTPIPTGSRYRAAGTSCDGRHLYVFGGWGSNEQLLDEAWKYTPATDTWKELAPMPVPLTNMEAACIGSFIYLVGGYAGYEHTNNFFIYDTLEDSWVASTWPNASTPMTAVWNGKLYTFGGFPGPRNDIWVYDPLEDSWEGPIGSMPFEIGYGSATTVGDSIYLVGGSDGQYLLNSILRFDPVTISWDATGPALLKSRMSPLVTWYGDSLYVFHGGGKDGEVWNPLESSEVYSPTLWPEGSWVVTDSLDLPMVGMAGGCVDSRVWAIGGNYGNGGSSATQYFDSEQACHYTQGSDLPWLSKTPAVSTLQPGESISVTLTLDASLSTIQQGMYRAFLTVVSDDPVRPRMQVPIRMYVGQRVFLPLVRR